MIMRWLKRIVITAVVLGLILLVGAVSVLYVTFNKVNQMIATGPDADLIALERLVADKTITLTGEQKDRLAPIIKDITMPGQTPEQLNVLKNKLWNNIDPVQLKAVKDWRVTAEKSAGNFIKSGKDSIAQIVSDYTGIGVEQSQKIIDSLPAWMQLKGNQSNSADRLLKAVEGN